MKPIVQISLDLTNIDEALETAAMAMRAGVDWLEAGTPLILAEGLHGVKKLREAFPGIVPDHYINLDPARSPQAICGNNPFSGEDPGYHSSPAGQEIIAENFYKTWLDHFK